MWQAQLPTTTGLLRGQHTPGGGGGGGGIPTYLPTHPTHMITK
jgi:hypothetical protein